MTHFYADSLDYVDAAKDIGWRSLRENLISKWGKCRPEILTAFLRRQFIHDRCRECDTQAVIRYIYIYISHDFG